MPGLETTNLLAGYGTLGLLLLSLGYVGALTFPGLVPQWKERYLSTYGVWIAFVVTLLASAVTLYYSEVLGVLPCSYCWLQRVALYPQVVLFLIAAIVKDRTVALYSIALSLIGAAVALYHHYLQMGGSSFLPCPATGNHLDCAEPTFVMWGFVTFPFMSFALFLFLILFMVYLRSTWRKSHTATGGPSAL